MPRRELLLKWFAYGLALAAVTVLNYSILIYLPDAIPLLLPMSAVAVGTLEGPKFGAGHGIAAGLILYAVAHTSAAAIPLLSLTGWLAGLMAKYVLRQDLVGHCIFAILAMLLWEGGQLGLRYLAGTAPLPVLARVAIPELVWTLVLSLPVYAITRFCCVHFGRLYYE